jgi:hypothetical protein
LQGLSSTTTTTSSSSSSSGSLYSTTSAELGRVSSVKEQQQQPKLSRRFSWPHQCVMGCKGSACMPTETYGAVTDVLGVSTAGASAAGGSQGAAAAAAAAGSSTAAAVAAGVSPQVLMNLHYKLHLKAMVLPRR